MSTCRLFCLFVLALTQFCSGFVPRLQNLPTDFPFHFSSFSPEYFPDGSMIVQSHLGDFSIGFGNPDGSFQNEIKPLLPEIPEGAHRSQQRIHVVDGKIFLYLTKTIQDSAEAGAVIQHSELFLLSKDASEVFWQQNLRPEDGIIFSATSNGRLIALSKSIETNVGFEYALEVRKVSDGSLVRRYPSSELSLGDRYISMHSMFWNDDRLIIARDRLVTGLRYQPLFFQIDFSISDDLRQVELPDEVVQLQNGSYHRANSGVGFFDGRLYLLQGSSVLNFDPNNPSDAIIVPLNNLARGTTSMSGDWVQVKNGLTLITYSARTGKMVLREALSSPFYRNPRRQAEMPEVRVESVQGNETEGVVRVQLALDRPLKSELRFFVDVESGSALEGDDFIAPRPIEVVFGAGEDVAWISIPLIDDSLVEPAETMTLSWSSSLLSTEGKSQWLVSIPGTSLVSSFLNPDESGQFNQQDLQFYRAIAGPTYQVTMLNCDHSNSQSDVAILVEDILTGQEVAHFEPGIRTTYKGCHLAIDGDYLAVGFPESISDRQVDELGIVELYSISENRRLHQFRRLPVEDVESDEFGQEVLLEAPYLVIKSRIEQRRIYHVYRIDTGEKIKEFEFDDNRHQVNLNQGILALINERTNPPLESQLIHLDGNREPLILDPQPSWLEMNYDRRDIVVFEEDLYLVIDSGRVVLKYDGRTGKIAKKIPIPTTLISLDYLGSGDGRLIGLGRESAEKKVQLLILNPEDLSILDKAPVDLHPGNFTSLSDWDTILRVFENPEGVALEFLGTPHSVVFLQPHIPELHLLDSAVLESAQTPTMLLELSEKSSEPFTLQLFIQDGTARSWEDFDPSPQEITIPGGVRTARIPVPVFNDQIVEEDETAIVTLSHEGKLQSKGELTIVSEDLPLKESTPISTGIGSADFEVITTSDLSGDETHAFFGQPFFAKDGKVIGRALVVSLETGEIEREITAHKIRENSLFGAAVAITDNYFIVGDPGGPGLPQKGRVQFFSRATGEFVKTIALGEKHSTFGGILATNQSHLFVGDLGSYTELKTGRVFAFDLTNFDRVEIKASRSSLEDFFGEEISSDENFVLIGSSGREFNETTRRGSIDIFSAKTFEHLGTFIEASSRLDGYGFGENFDFNGDLCVVATGSTISGFSILDQNRLWKIERPNPWTGDEALEVSVTADFAIVSISGANESTILIHDHSGNLVETITDPIAEISLATMSGSDGFTYLKQLGRIGKAPSLINLSKQTPPSFDHWIEEQAPPAPEANSIQAKKDYLERFGGSFDLTFHSDGSLEILVPDQIGHDFEIDLEWSSDLTTWQRVGMVGANGQLGLSPLFDQSNGRISRKLSRPAGFYRLIID